jgi:hypothetical protein
MAEKENSALRLYRFIEKMVPQQPPNKQTAQVLVDAFGFVKGASQREQNVILARVMGLLFDELESLVADLRRAGHSEQSIEPIVRPFDSLSGGGLATQWSAHVQLFSASLPVLLMVGETYPADSVAVSQEELSELSNSIEKLRTEVQNSTLPEEVKRYVFEQLDIITRAIRDYPLAGAKAFKAAVRESIFHTGEHAEVVTEYQDTPELNGLKQIQEKAVAYAKYAIEVSKFVGALDSLYHHAQAAPAVAHQLVGLVQHVLK